jgi:hypothetical protein
MSGADARSADLLVRPVEHAPLVRERRPRYQGRNPRRFHEKYKELNPDRYEAEVRKVVESGKTPAGTAVIAWPAEK